MKDHLFTRMSVDMRLNAKSIIKNSKIIDKWEKERKRDVYGRKLLKVNK